MSWSQGIGCFFGGVFFANALPHLIAGASGQPMPTPFASPPFKGLSSPVVNVAWALSNLAAAYLLALRLGAFDPHRWLDAGLAFAGFGLMALQVARSLTRLRAAGGEPGA